MFQATRKAVKCGYLFVAPGRDFTNPINRTKVNITFLFKHNIFICCLFANVTPKIGFENS